MISIIIVTFDSQDHIAKCLGSLIHYIKNNIEVLVIDNASSDKTVEIIKKYFPQVKLIQNITNIGFTRACNQGARITKGKYLLFLNPDTVIKNKDDLKLLLNFAQSKKKLGAIGVKVLNPDGSIQPSFGNLPTLPRIIFDRLPFFKKNYGIQVRNLRLYKHIHRVDWVSGCCLLVKKKIFDEVGGFNEDIFMYGEDYDLCYRLKKKGYENYYYSKFQIMHKDSGKNDVFRKPHKYFSMRKGFLIFMRKHKSFFDYLIINCLIKIESIYFLFFLNVRTKNRKEKDLWRRYLLETLRLNV